MATFLARTSALATLLLLELRKASSPDLCDCQKMSCGDHGGEMPTSSSSASAMVSVSARGLVLEVGCWFIGGELLKVWTKIELVPTPLVPPEAATRGRHP